jgi:hypothetical protein
MQHDAGAQTTVASGHGLALAMILFSIVGLAVVACGARSAPAAPNEGTSDPAPALAIDADAEMILHHWQALTAIQTDDVRDAVHHVEHILERVRGDHRATMLEVLENLDDGRLHLAEHAIEEMLSSEAEPNLSPGLVHVQMGLAALGRDDARAATHHVDHYLDVATEAAVPHGLDALAALGGDELLDAGLHLSEAARVEVERLEVDRACSGTGMGHPGLRDGRIALTIALDEEWVARHGDRAVAAALALVEATQTTLGALGVTLDVLGVERWASPPGLSLHEMSHAAVTAGLLGDEADLLLVLTDQDAAGSTDGIHVDSAGSPAIAIRHHRDRPDRDAIVVAHEVGHLLDLTHKPGTFMQARGFVETPYWSLCQRDAVQRLFAQTAASNYGDDLMTTRSSRTDTPRTGDSAHGRTAHPLGPITK